MDSPRYSNVILRESQHKSQALDGPARPRPWVIDLRRNSKSPIPYEGEFRPPYQSPSPPPHREPFTPAHRERPPSSPSSHNGSGRSGTSGERRSRWDRFDQGSPRSISAMLEHIEDHIGSLERQIAQCRSPSRSSSSSSQSRHSTRSESLPPSPKSGYLSPSRSESPASSDSEREYGSQLSLSSFSSRSTNFSLIESDLEN